MVFSFIEKTACNMLGASGHLLDVGCGAGDFLAHASTYGWKTLGIDIHAQAVISGRNRGFQIIKGEIMDVDISDRKFDLITFMNTIGYLADPGKALKKAHNWLTDDGILVIETPNTKYHFWQMKIFRLFRREQDTMVVSPETDRRLFAFGEHAIHQLLESAGFSRIKIYPAFARREGGIFKIAVRALIYSLGRFVYYVSRGRLLYTPSMVVFAEK